jgi:hypothetical protein
LGPTDARSYKKGKSLLRVPCGHLFFLKGSRKTGKRRFHAFILDTKPHFSSFFDLAVIFFLHRILLLGEF